MRLAWATDLHLNFSDGAANELFFASLVEAAPDAVLITGDIGESGSWRWHLRRIEERVNKPVWFVLGNHDYYRSSIRAVRVSAAAERWLPARGVVLLSESTAMIGHDGWADGRLGDYAGSRVMLNDFLLISELVSPNSAVRRAKLEQLGDEAAQHFRHWLPAALARRKRILIATHVPPFRDACWHEGGISDDDWLPHFTCAAVGDVLLEAAAANPEHEFLVLCGHTHGAGSARISPNLEVVTGGAEYGNPVLQSVWEL